MSNGVSNGMSNGGNPTRQTPVNGEHTILHINSGVAQWLACWAHNPKVRGSKPRSATAFNCGIDAVRSRVRDVERRETQEPPVGFEPTTSRLLSGCSAN